MKSRLAPFASIPKRDFLARMLIPMLALSALGVALASAGLSSAEGARSTASSRYAEARSRLDAMPSACSSEVPRSPEERQICDRLWKSTLGAATEASLPLTLPLAFLLVVFQIQTRGYERARMKLRSHGGLKAHVDPDHAKVRRFDLYAWVFGLRPAWAEWDGQRRQVYLSTHRKPIPGQPIRAVQVGRFLGKPRYWAVVEGSRTHRV